eukprot:gene19228-19112_t
MQTTLFLDRALLPDGWTSDVRITADNGLISAVETGAAPASGEAREALGVPGLPNLHSHAFQRAMAGLAERRGPAQDSFWTWREVMYRFLARLGPDDVEAIAAYAFADMLEAGFTAVAEFHYLHHDPDGGPYADVAELARRHLKAAGDTGIGVTMLPVFYAHATFGGEPPTPGQRRFINDPGRFARIVGVPPRMLAAILRFRGVFEALSESGVTSWTDAAQAAGYFDHPQLARDFRRFVGCTPSQFLAQQAGLAASLVEA